MAKNVTKSVIEDMAYQLKRVGIIIHEWAEWKRMVNLAEVSPEMEKTLSSRFDDWSDGNGGWVIDFSSPEDVLDWVIDNTHDVFAEHDPTFNSTKFQEQTQYKL